jgi:hypothetical protein
MTVPVQTPVQNISAAGGQTIFPFTFRCDDGTTIHVYKNDVEIFGGVVALNLDQSAAPGGNVTIGAATAGDIVTVERQGSPQQNVAINPFGSFPAATVMAMMDKIVMLVQELIALLGRAIRVTRANAAKLSTTDLPAPLVGTFLYFADAGGGLLKLATAALSGGGGGVFFDVVGEAVTRTGAGTYQLASTPTPLSSVKLYLNGARLQLGTHYTITAGGAITQLPGFVSDVTEVMLADYTHA